MRGYTRAQKFGMEMAIPDEVVGLDALSHSEPGRFVLKSSNRERVSAHAAVIAGGGPLSAARSRRPRKLSRVQACTIAHPSA